MTMRTVTLELLRHGPSHNQLISPLTPYLALCGNQDAETVHVAFEHLQITRYIEQLRYAYGMRMASVGLQDAAREVSRLLESIRSLTKELASSDPAESRRMIHLRLVLSASELAMLPFELATSNASMPGQGQPLSLQTATPLCLTREVRRVAATTLQWPQEPRLLFVTAAPRIVSAVPAREHVEKLKAALAPYVDMEKPGKLDEHLTVLPEATLEDVREACSRRAYTHVHILAHGIAREATGDEARYGLAFHAGRDRSDVDVVSGERLASALRCHMKPGLGQVLSSPAVVTIASCDSANVGNVVAPGASIAHSLHEQGIPLVIGSQFPLSIKGSNIMVGLLYERMLAGDDPRVIVHDLRQALHTAHPENHDWASVVVYAALPNSLQSQLQKARFEQARRALNVLIARTDAALAKAHLWISSMKKDASPQPETKEISHLEGLKQQLLDAMSRFEVMAPQGEHGPEQEKAWGVLASAWKTVALFLSFETPSLHLRKSAELLKDETFRGVLEKARHYYYKCYQMGSSEAWPLVQYLALTSGLQLHTDPRTSKIARIFKLQWAEARSRAEDKLRWGGPQQKAWACASLVELALLSVPWRKWERCCKEAFQYTNRALEIRDLGQYKLSEFDARSLRLQLNRYYVWHWGTPEASNLSGELVDLLGKRGVEF